jgi:conjugative relaxase-like TrwC/TraI family protein
MLTISKPLSSARAQSYHKLEFTSETQNYYKQGETVEGEWHGKLAASLGLSGTVSPADFARLADGQNPQTEEQMVQHRAAQEYSNADGTKTQAVEHRASWDATFSAPKSVSLTALVGGDDRVREAHRAAVNIALDELERYTQARIGGNNPAETTGKFVAAKFEHDTARPVDGYAAPQLHTHAVIFNVTEREDGSTRALQPQSLFETQNYATAVYQSALTYQLRNLGYEIERGRSGAPEIKGYTQEYLDASSPRSQQIREHLEKIGYSGPEAAQIAAHTTRDRKQTLTPDEVLTAHKTMAADFGNQPEQVIAAARERANQQGRQPDAQYRAREAVTYARATLFEREAVADERAILRDSLRRGMGETTFQDVRAEFDSRQQHGDFLRVSGHKYASGRSFTTIETIAHERANVRHVLEGRNAVEPMMKAEKAEAHAQSRSFLNSAQRTVIEEVLNSSDRIHGLQGLAGTGKTTTLEVIREGAERSGYAVEGFAPSSKAAGQLRDAGISSSTLQSFLARQTASDDPDAKHLYMLDESSLTSSRQMRQFLEKIGSQDRVLLIGDTRQHQAVEAGRPFQQMQEAGMQTSQLDRIMRQKDPELLKAVEHLARNETETGIRMLADQGRVTEIPNGNDRVQAIARDYANQPDRTIIVSPDNRSRQAINDAVRAELLRSGALGDDGQVLRTLAHRSDMTGADRTWAARYELGDVLQYNTGSKAEGIKRGSFATVRAVDAKANNLTVEMADGESVTYDPRRLRGVSAYRETPREFATGDRIQFTSADKSLGISNRDLGTITHMEPGRMSVKLEGREARSIHFNQEQMPYLDHGYAVTSYSSQGLTTGRVLANIDTESPRSLINTRLAYVAISRASDDVRVYTNHAKSLGERLSHDVNKTAAIEFSPPGSPVSEIQEAVEALRSQNVSNATELLKQQGRIHEYASRDHRLAAVAIDYTSRPDKAVVIAPDRGERQELTQLIRAELQSQGRLSAESHAVPVLVEQEFFNPKLAANYSAGELIQYKTGNAQKHGIASGSMATVISTDSNKNLLTVETKDGERVAYNPAQLRRLTAQSTVYREETRDLAQGERIQFTQSDKEHRIRSGDFATVEWIADDNRLTVRLDNGKSFELNRGQARHIDYGYAGDGLQRIAADRVIGTAEKLEPATLARVWPYTRDLVVYTSESAAIQTKEPTVAKVPNLAQLIETSQGLSL